MPYACKSPQCQEDKDDQRFIQQGWEWRSESTKYNVAYTIDATGDVQDQETGDVTDSGDSETDDSGMYDDDEVTCEECGAGAVFLDDTDYNRWINDDTTKTPKNIQNLKNRITKP